MTTNKISKKWRQMSEVYIIFTSGYNDLDFSESAASEMYQFETYGIGNLKQGLFNPSGSYNMGNH